MKYLALGLVVTALVLTPALVAAQDQTNLEIFTGFESKIPDPRLRAALEEALGKPFGVLTLADLERVTHFSAEGRQIESVQGIDHLRSLEILDLSQNRISDLSQLKALSNLRQLDVLDNPLDQASVSSLTSSSLPRLEGIALRATDHGTRYLDASATLAMLATHGNLRYLTLWNFAELDDGDFAQLYQTVFSKDPERIYELQLTGTRISDASLRWVARLKGLRLLALWENREIRDLAGLVGLGQLQSLWVNGTGVRDLAPLRTLAEAGCFQDTQGPRILDVQNLGLDLSEGSPYRAVVDGLLAQGVEVRFLRGNTLTLPAIPLSFLFAYAVFLCLYNLYRFLGTRDEAYAWYIGFVVIAAALIVLLTGSLGSSRGAAAAVVSSWNVVGLVGCTVVGVAFANVAQWRGRSPRMRVVTLVCVGVGVASLLPLLAQETTASLGLAFAHTAASTFTVGVLLGFEVAQGNRFAKFFGVAWVLIGVGLITAAWFLLANLVPGTLLINGLVGGLVVTTALVSLGLAERLSDERRTAFEQKDRIDQQERLAALGTLASKVAHEIGNPNHVIGLQVSLLQRLSAGVSQELWERAQDGTPIPADDPGFEVLRQEIPRILRGINEASSQITRIVQQLRTDIVAPTALTDRVDLRDLVRETLKLYEPKYRLATRNFSLRTSTEPVRVLCCAPRLQQLLLNLVNNAADALTSRDQAIEVRVERGIGREGQAQAILSVKDEGKGIPGHLTPRLGEPFLSTRRTSGGTGLGLSVCFDVAGEHRGTLEFETGESLGTTVTFRMSLTEV